MSDKRGHRIAQIAAFAIYISPRTPPPSGAASLRSAAATVPNIYLLPRIQGGRSTALCLFLFGTSAFDSNESAFVGISTGRPTLAHRDVARDTIDAHKIGMAAYEEFMRDWFEDEITKAQFHDKIAKKRLSNMFSDIRRKSSASNSNNVILQADRNLFAHMVLVAESRHLRMSDVLSHPLEPLPWTLANANGTMRKTNKAALARELERHVLPAKPIPEPYVTTTDGMNDSGSEDEWQ